MYPLSVRFFLISCPNQLFCSQSIPLSNIETPFFTSNKLRTKSGPSCTCVRCSVGDCGLLFVCNMTLFFVVCLLALQRFVTVLYSIVHRASGTWPPCTWLGSASYTCSKSMYTYTFIILCVCCNGLYAMWERERAIHVCELL